MADLNTIGGLHYEIMRRCYNPNSKLYKSYGAVGITVCEEWHDRENFRKWCLENGWHKPSPLKNSNAIDKPSPLKDSGAIDKPYPLKRYDNSKPYCPENCYFGIPKEKSGKDWKYIKRRAEENKKKKLEIGIENLIDHPLYSIYTSMHTRCDNPNHIQYHHYGGRGIKVCDEWCGKNGSYNFIKWATQNGWKDGCGLTIDRIDNDKGYSPSNCRWITMKEQLRNRRTSRYFTYRNKKVYIKDLSDEIGIKYNVLYTRVYKLQNGESIDLIVDTLIKNKEK